MACPLATERVWTDKVQYHAAEKQYHEYLSKLHNTGIKNETGSENDNTNQVKEADGLRFQSPVKKISKNQRKRQQRGSAADEDGNLDATVSDSSTTRDVKMDVKKNSKKQRNVPQTNDAVAKPKEKSNGGKNKPRNLPQQSSIEDESLTESIAQEIKSPMKKIRTNNKGKIQLQPSGDEVYSDLLGDESPQKPQNRNPNLNQAKRVQQQRANYDSNELADQKHGPHKKESKNKPNGNETDSMKRQKNIQNKKNSVWSDDDRNLPSTVEEKNEHKSPGFETQAHPDDAELRNEEQFIEVPNKRKRSRRAKKDKQVASFAAFTANDGKTNSSRSDSISSIDIQSVDFVIAEEVSDKTKDIKEFQNKVHQKKSSDNFALKETNDNRIYDTVVNVVDNILKEQVKNRGAGPSSLASEIAKARQHIKNSLERMDGIAALASTPSAELLDRLSFVEKQNALLQTTVNNLQDIVGQLEEKIRALESRGGKPTVQTANTSSQVTKSPPAPAAAPQPTEDDDDGVDLFGSDSEDEDEAATKVREQRLADYAAKKSKKQALIAKSNIILDIKPWSDETDMKQMEIEVRAIKMDGLLWGAAKLVPLAYGIHKLQISTVVEDEKVSIDALQEEITNIEDLVQSVDIAAFNKI